MKILIAGSRTITPEIEGKIRRLIRWAGDQQHIILVGDAPGSDAAVVNACTAVNVVCVCVGISPEPRNGGAKNPRSTYINLRERPDFQTATYADRDRELVRCANRVVCFWDGQSPGTKAVYDLASQSRYKPVLLRNYKLERVR